MKVIFLRKVQNVIEKIYSKKNILKHHTLFGLFLGFASLSVMFLMTGALYFRNEARIYDGGNVIRTFTMYDELDEILDEQKITLGEYDRVDFGGVKNGEANIVIHRSLNIPVVADGKTVLVECAYNETVQDILKRTDIVLEDQDVVEPDVDTQCSQLTQVEIHRGYPVYVKADGTTKELAAYYQTAEEILKRSGIVLKEDDCIDCDFDKVLKEGDTVTVTRIRYEKAESYEVIPYNTITQTNNLVSMYSTEVTQKGETGTRTNVSLIKYVDGKKESVTAVSSSVTKEPIAEIVSTGTALKTPYSKKDNADLKLENGLPVNYQTVLTGKSCAYTASKGSGTASGRKLEIGTVAVDPSVIPYGSELYIVSCDGSYVYGYAIAADTGDLTAHGVLVDLYMGNSEDYYYTSLNYGAKQVNVYVLSWGA